MVQFFKDFLFIVVVNLVKKSNIILSTKIKFCILLLVRKIRTCRASFFDKSLPKVDRNEDSLFAS